MKNEKLLGSQIEYGEYSFYQVIAEGVYKDERLVVLRGSGSLSDIIIKKREEFIAELEKYEQQK